MSENEIYKKSVLIIGILPPPIGGVSIHLQRLIREIDIKGKNINLQFYDYKKHSRYDGLKNIFLADIIHTNYSNKLVRFLSTILFRLLRKKTIITFHGKYDFNNLLDGVSLKLSSFNFVLNEFSLSSGLKKLKNADKIILIPAFIPPNDNEELQSEIKNKILEFKNSFQKIYCTNAHNYILNKEGKDLYGIDFLLNIFTSSDKFLQFGLIVSDPSGNLYNKYKTLSEKKNILFLSEPHPFVEVIKLSDVFIRSTTSDGDSLSVKEALYFNKKVIASDCVDRPNGCIIYKTNDIISFEMCLENNEVNEVPLLLNGADFIIAKYNEL